MNTNPGHQFFETPFLMAFQTMVKKAVDEALADKEQQQVKQALRPPAGRKEAARFLGISLPTLNILLRTEQIKHFRVGVQIRINWSDLERFIEEKGQ